MAPPPRTLWRFDFEELPVEVEALIGAREAAGEHPVDEQLLPDFERIHPGDGHVHEGAGGADDQRGHAGDAGGDGVGEREAVEGRDVGGAEVLKGQDENRVLRGFLFGGLAEALGEHGEQAGGALFFFGCGGRREGRRLRRRE